MKTITIIFPANSQFIYSLKPICRCIIIFTLFFSFYATDSKGQKNTFIPIDSTNHQEKFINIINKLKKEANKQSPKSANAISLDSVYLFKDYGSYIQYNREYYSYNNNGTLNKTINLRVDEFGEFKDVTETKTYNPSELLIDHTIEKPGFEYRSSYNFDTTVIAGYHAKYIYQNNLLKERSIKNLDDYRFEENIEHYLYNSKNRLIVYTSKFDSSFYFYDSIGRIDYELYYNRWGYLRIQLFSYENLVDTIRTYQKEYYDEVTSIPNFDSIETWKEPIVFEEIFDTKGRLISLSKKGRSSYVLYPDYRMEFEYTDNNKLKKATYYSLPDTVDKQEVMRLENTYNTDNNLKFSISHIYDEYYNDWKVYETKTYYYSSELVGIKQELKPSIKVYPNPAKNKLIILKGGTSETIDLEITNISGDKMLEKKSIYNNYEELNISHFGYGIYFVRIKSNLGLSTFKIIKQ